MRRGGVGWNGKWVEWIWVGGERYDLRCDRHTHAHTRTHRCGIPVIWSALAHAHPEGVFSCLETGRGIGGRKGKGEQGKANRSKVSSYSSLLAFDALTLEDWYHLTYTLPLSHCLQFCLPTCLNRSRCTLIKPPVSSAINCGVYYSCCCFWNQHIPFWAWLQCVYLSMTVTIKNQKTWG